MNVRQGPWGIAPNTATEFGVLRVKGEKAELQMAATADGARVQRFPIDALTLEFIRSFGPGTYKLRYHRTSGGGPVSYSAKFEITPVTPKEADEVASVPTVPTVPVSSSASPTMGEMQRLIEADRDRNERHTQALLDRERAHLVQLEVARTAGKQELLQEMNMFRQMFAQPAASPDAMPAWAAALVAEVRTLKEKVEEFDDEEDDEEEEDGEKPNLAQALELTPMQAYLFDLLERHGPPLVEALAEKLGEKMPAELRAKKPAHVDTTGVPS